MRSVTPQDTPVNAVPSQVMPFRTPNRDVDRYFVLDAIDDRLAAELAEEIAGTHIARYKDQRYADLAGLPRADRAWYCALAAFTLRYCRRPWRVYAHYRAVERGVQVVNDVMSHCFMEPSKTHGGLFVKMSPEKVRALVSILVNEVVQEHLHALDGTLPPSHADIERLHAEEQRS